MKVGSFIKCESYDDMFVRQEKLKEAGISTLRKLSANGIRGYYLKVTEISLNKENEVE